MVSKFAQNHVVMYFCLLSLCMYLWNWSSISIKTCSFLWVYVLFALHGHIHFIVEYNFRVYVVLFCGSALYYCKGCSCKLLCKDLRVKKPHALHCVSFCSLQTQMFKYDTWKVLSYFDENIRQKMWSENLNTGVGIQCEQSPINSIMMILSPQTLSNI